MKGYPQQFLMTLKKMLKGEEAESFIKGRLEKKMKIRRVFMITIP